MPVVPESYQDYQKEFGSNQLTDGGKCVLGAQRNYSISDSLIA
jgi:hypothetical protein